MGKNLYSLNSLNCTDGGAPKAVPQSYSGVAQNGNAYVSRDSVGGASGAINVVNDFQWTTSPPGASSRTEVPRILLREKRLKTNALISAAAYYIMSTAGTGGRILDRLEGGLLGSAGRGLASTLNNLGSVLGGAVGGILNQNIDSLGMSVLKPYEGLYITEDTGFKYTFPYFSDTQQMLMNSFEVNDDMLRDNTILGKAVNTLRSVAESTARLASFYEPGLYIERPKFFNFKSTGDTVQFSFPLINTGWSTFDDVRLNWQLAFLLTYQNNPNRRTREIIDPPAIYEVTIPGIKYIPFAFIRNLSIKYVGARRAYKIDAPGAGEITTIIPDAYIIDITLEGLVADTKNFMYASITGKNDVVNVSTTGTFNIFSEVQDLFGGSI